jgi:hypothetical protein
MKRPEKQLILTHTSLQWVRKNIYQPMTEIFFPDGFLQIEHDLKQIGYCLNPHITNSHTTIGIWFDSPLYQIVIDIPLRKINNIRSFFQFISDHFPAMQGYTGSKEWQRDICQQYKISMINELSYLDPPNYHYWFKNELYLKKE